jgi:hypothetical protein
MSAVLRLLRLAVVVAAGVAAWFGYEEFAAAQDSQDQVEVADAVDSGPGVAAPWAGLGLVVSDAIWDGPTLTTTQRAGDVERHSMIVDPRVGRVQLSLFDGQGLPVGVAELDSNEAFVAATDGTWEQARPDGLVSESVLRSMVADAAPRTLTDLVPEALWPFAEVVADRPGEASAPTRVLTIRIYGGAFAADEPALAAQWRSTADPVVRRGRVEIEVEVDQQGNVVGLRTLPPDEDVQYRFGPASPPPMFQAPFVD